MAPQGQVGEVGHAAMRGHLVRLGQQTVVYGLSGVALQLVGVITLPVMARVLSTSQYGQLELVTAGLAAASIFIDLGLASASQRSYFDYTDDQREERRVVLSTTIVTSLAAALIIMAATIVLRNAISQALFGSTRYADLAVIAALTFPATALANISREIMRLHFRAWHYLISSVLGALTGAVFIVVALTALKMHVNGALWGAVVGSAVSATYGVIAVRRDIGAHYSIPELRTMLDYGLPLVPTAASLWGLALVDRLMLAHISSLSEVGEYAMANKAVLVLTMATVAFATAFAPFMLAIYSSDPEEEKQVRARTLTWVTIGYALLAVVVSLYAREIFALVAPAFHSAYEAVGLLAFGAAANGVANVALGGISLARQTRQLVLYTGVSAALNIGLNIIVIPVWGMVGAAFATAVAYLLLLALYYWRAQRVYPTPYQPSRVLGVAALAAPAMAVGAIPIEPLGVALAIKTAVLLAFVVLLPLVRIVRREELAALRLTVRERLGLAAGQP